MKIYGSDRTQSDNNDSNEKALALKRQQNKSIQNKLHGQLVEF